MDPTSVIGLALGAVALGMLYGLRKRVSKLELLVLRLQDRATSLEYPATPPAPASLEPIDTEPFVD